MTLEQEILLRLQNIEDKLETQNIILDQIQDRVTLLKQYKNKIARISMNGAIGEKYNYKNITITGEENGVQ